MPSTDFPKLRPLSAQRFDHQGRPHVMLQDPLGVFTDPVLVPLPLFLHVVRHFDGRTSRAEVQARVRRDTGETISDANMSRIVDELDAAMVLDGPRFAEFVASFRSASERPAYLAGRSYAGNPADLRGQIARCFSSRNGAGPPALPAPTASAPDRSDDRGIRAILSPHIDFGRGGPVYSWAYKELVERGEADIYVILGVAHQYCRHPYALTTKDFRTPMGVARTDREYVARIAAAAGSEYFDDELVHRAEHSIEFQVVFLQYVLGERRDYSIVPILVGSFHEHVVRGREPIEDASVRRFIEALRAAEVASGKRVMYIGGIDLCHVGPEFGDPDPVDGRLQETVRAFDRAMLDRAAAGDASGWFRTAANVANRWRVCGLAATYTMLRAIGPARGELLRYEQALDDRRTCCVSFASMVFRQVDAPSPDPLQNHVNNNAP